MGRNESNKTSVDIFKFSLYINKLTYKQVKVLGELSASINEVNVTDKSHKPKPKVTNKSIKNAYL